MQERKAVNGFVSGDELPEQAPELPPAEQELADFLARAAIARNCEASSFVGRKVCRSTQGDTRLLVFADEVEVPIGDATWGVSAEVANQAGRQARFMQGLGEGTSRGRDQGGTAAFAELLKRCSHEIQQDGRVMYKLDKTNIFVDHGRQLMMEPAADQNEEAILVALLLAKEKFKTFELTGDADFQRRALEIMVRHNLDVPLKNAAQQVLRDELQKARDAERSAQPSADTGQHPIKPGNGVALALQSGQRTPERHAEQSKAQQGEATRCVDAHAWWQAQVAIINSAARSEKDKEEQLHALGPAPEEGKAWWFDSSGNPRPQPKDPEVVQKLREAAGMAVARAVAPAQATAPANVLPMVMQPGHKPTRRSAPFAR